MKADFNALWAESPVTLRREPTNTEMAGGFPCGDLDLPLFNELIFRLAQVYRELSYVIAQSGQTPNANNTTQVWQAIKGSLIVNLTAIGARGRFKQQNVISDLVYDINAVANYQSYNSEYTDLGTFTVPSGYVCVDLNATCFIAGGSGAATTCYLGIFGNANDGTGWFLVESNRVSKPAGSTVTLGRPGLLSLDPAKSYTFSARMAKDSQTTTETGVSGNLLGLAFKF